MATTIRMSILASAFLIGCSSSFQVGLANAPWLGGDTPETRVHDVLANGHDSCERSAFPQGDVLKGHVPPCSSEKSVTTVPMVLREPPPSSPRTSPRHFTGVCRSPGPGLTRTEIGVPGLSLGAPGPLVCNEAL
jgi:hypothetical protein